MQNFFQQIWLESQLNLLWDNSISQYIISFVIFILSWTLLKLIKKHFINKIYKKSKSNELTYHAFLISILNDISTLTYFTFSLFISSLPLQVTPTVVVIIRGLFLLSLAVELSKASAKTIDFYFQLKHKKANKVQKTNLNALKLLVQIFVLTFGILAVIDNLGFDIKTLIASLGIGGIAVALAAQNILGDLFSSFALYLDRPFEEGDFIEISPTVKGTIKSIGIKSTRLKGPQGEEIIVSNRELTSAAVQNTGRITERRIIVKIGVDYKTSQKLLEEIPEILESITKEVENTEFKLAFIKELGDYSINYKYVYHVLTGSYADYSRAHHQIMLKIKKAFDKKKINIVFPTQTVYLKK